MKTKNKMENRPAQRDSKMSNGRLSGLFCRWQGGRLPETTPAQRDSKMSNLGMGLISPMGPIGLMVQKPVMENGPAQRDSGNSKLGVLGILRSLGILGGKTKNENCPTQQDSEISILKTGPYRPLAVRLVPLCGDPYSPLCFKNRPAQQDSGMSILRMGRHCHTESAKNKEEGIFTINIKNIMICFTGKWVNASMSKMQNVSAQRYSKMSNLKIETENSFPQRHSKMSNGRLSGLLCRPHGQRAMFTTQIKNIIRCFMSSLDYGWVGKPKSAPAQRDSGISVLKTSPYRPYRPYRPLDFKNRPAQQDSGISSLENRSSSPLCPLVFKTSPVQQDSGNSKFGQLPGLLRSWRGYMDFSIKKRGNHFIYRDIFACHGFTAILTRL